MPDGLAPSLLFFGCRREDEDFLYKEDLNALVADRTLTTLRTAFSRAQANKVYVQHLIRDSGAQLATLIDAGAYVYICGDGAGMAKDVHAALVGVLQQHGGLSEAEAMAKMAALHQEKRYVKDVWS